VGWFLIYEQGQLRIKFMSFKDNRELINEYQIRA
jgi:hypothetical protein